MARLPDSNPNSLARRSGRELLEAMVWAGPTAADAPARLAEALGVRSQPAEDLTANLFADLDETTAAIGWWGDAGDGRERLIADHFVHAAGDLPKLLLEARIHLMDLIDIWARQEAEWQPRLEQNPTAQPFDGTQTLDDDLDGIREDMNLAGFFRALAQVMDCLAVVVIGALDLPLDIHRASWTRITKALKSAEADPARATVAADLLTALDAAGPPGWLDWVLDSRNMQLHRPRLMRIVQPTVLGGGLTIPGHALVERARLTHHLPSAPKTSFIEAFVIAAGPDGAYLTEDGQLTLEHALHSVATAVAGFCGLLESWWSERRGDPELQVQVNAAKQWTRRPGPADRFGGYAPGSATFDGASAMVINTSVARRLSAAAVGDDRRNGVSTGATWPKPAPSDPA